MGGEENDHIVPIFFWELYQFFPYTFSKRLRKWIKTLRVEIVNFLKYGNWERISFHNLAYNPACF